MIRSRYSWWPITLGVVMLVLLVALAAGWILLPLIPEDQSPGLFWTIAGLGGAFLLLVGVGVLLYLRLALQEIRLNHRQSNFIDSVTHELKSPIASLKLYLQTLSRRQPRPDERDAFYGFMLKDLERLDHLINHLLDAARLEHDLPQAALDEVSVPDVLAQCAESACLRYHLPKEAVELDVEPAVVRCRQADLDIVFRNLVDNAIKYSGAQPEIRVECRKNSRGQVVTRVMDNGPGIPLKERRKIFRRFVRLGDELIREKAGTGLGLYLVRTVVRKLKGKINVRSRVPGPGTVFEVVLPGAAA